MAERNISERIAHRLLNRCDAPTPSIDDALHRLSYSPHGPMHDTAPLVPAPNCGVCAALAVLRAVRPLLEELRGPMGDYDGILMPDDVARAAALLAPSGEGSAE